MSFPQSLPLDGAGWHQYWLPPREWRWRRVWEAEPPAAASRRLPAHLPGHPLRAAALAAGLEPYQRLHTLAYEWTAERDWVFERRFCLPELSPDARVFLRCEGVCGSTYAFLNGRELGAHQGQFAPGCWEADDAARGGAENALLLVVERAPELQGQVGRTSRERCWGSRFAAGWDFAPRLRPAGVWDSVSVEITGPARFRGAAVYANLARDRTEASVSMVTELDSLRELPALAVAEITQAGLPVMRVEDPITAFAGETALVQSAVIPRVQLWWPNGMGHPSLYEARFSLLDGSGRLLDRRVLPFGVRQVEAERCDGAPPDSLPYSLRVNGRRAWLRGWNWVPIDADFGRAGLAEYDRLLRLARAAHVNCLRVWGGGLLEKEVFYSLCDRYGIMVWQEFPLSSSGLDNTPPVDPEYLEYVRAEAERLLARRRHHPSLVLWCGGSELADDAGRPLGSDHPALAELHATVELEDPQRLWLPASPSGPTLLADPARRGALHDVHGPWVWLGLREHPRFYNGIDPLLHSAFGCEGAADDATLEWLFDGPPPPPGRDEPVWMHHGGDRWLRPESVAEAFGPLLEAATWAKASRLLQAQGLQYAVEAARRRQGRCAGALPWQLNEPWPNAVCTSAVDYFARPKPAYYAVKRAYRPFHVSAAFDRFDWDGEARFRADVWLHNDGEELALLNVVAVVTDLRGRELYQESLAAEAPAGQSEAVGDLDWRFPAGFAEPFLLFLEVVDEEGATLARTAYVHSRAPAPPYGPLLAAPATVLAGAREADRVTVRNTGAAVALAVTLAGDGVLVEESDFPLPPGAARELKASEGPLRVSAWNAPPVELPQR